MDEEEEGGCIAIALALEVDQRDVSTSGRHTVRIRTQDRELVFHGRSPKGIDTSADNSSPVNTITWI